MNKPEKKKLLPNINMNREQDGFALNRYRQGYNRACDDWEAFLPSEGELFNIITENTLMYDHDRRILAKAIAKRIGVEK